MSKKPSAAVSHHDADVKENTQPLITHLMAFRKLVIAVLIAVLVAGLVAVLIILIGILVLVLILVIHVSIPPKIGLRTCRSTRVRKTRWSHTG